MPPDLTSSPAPSPPIPQMTDSPLVADDRADREERAGGQQAAGGRMHAYNNNNDSSAKLPLSFANGMDDTLYEQLSAKLMDCRDAKLLSVTSDQMSKPRMHMRSSKSAGPSPRWGGNGGPSPRWGGSGGPSPRWGGNGGGWPAGGGRRGGGGDVLRLPNSESKQAHAMGAGGGG